MPNLDNCIISSNVKQESDLTVDRMRQIVEEELQSFSRGTPDEARYDFIFFIRTLRI